MKRKFIVEVGRKSDTDKYISGVIKNLLEGNLPNGSLFGKEITVKPYKEKSSCKHWKSDGIQPPWCWKKPPKIKYPICKQCDLGGSCHGMCVGFVEKKKKPKGRG